MMGMGAGVKRQRTVTPAAASGKWQQAQSSAPSSDTLQAVALVLLRLAEEGLLRDPQSDRLGVWVEEAIVSKVNEKRDKARGRKKD
jgi:hypothetical protein